MTNRDLSMSLIEDPRRGSNDSVASFASKAQSNANSDISAPPSGNPFPPPKPKTKLALVPSNQSGPLYRIGDGVKFYPNAPGCAEYPNSIVCDYQRRTQAPNSIPDLLHVLEARHQSDVPGPGVAVLHARLGDGLCAEIDWRCRRVSKGTSDCWNDIYDCAACDCVDENHHRYRYAYPKEYYMNVVKELNVNHLIIMASTNHFWHPEIKRNGTFADEVYLTHMTEFFESQGFEVELRLNGDIDTDFMYACAAHTFIQCGGGFSKLIAAVVKARGGTVLPTTKEDNIIYDLRPVG